MQTPQGLDATHGGEAFPVNESCAALMLLAHSRSPQLRRTWGGQDGGRNFGIAAVVASQTFGCLPLRSNTASAAPSPIRRRSLIRGHLALRQLMPPRRMAVISPSDNLVGLLPHLLAALDPQPSEFSLCHRCRNHGRRPAHFAVSSPRHARHWTQRGCNGGGRFSVSCRWR